MRRSGNKKNEEEEEEGEELTSAVPAVPSRALLGVNELLTFSLIPASTLLCSSAVSPLQR